MDQQFLDAYNAQRSYTLELASEWAKGHEKVARRLGMQVEGEIGDSYVERLIQAFSFVAARAQCKIDDSFPKFTQSLLETVFPYYNAPTPATAVARFYPGEFEGDVQSGFKIPRGAVLTSAAPVGEDVKCVFCSTQDVTLYPLEIVGAQLTAAPPDIPSLERRSPDYRKVRGALRLRLRASGRAIKDLLNLDCLPVYLSGDEVIASRLFELVHTAALGCVIGVPGQFAQQDGAFHVITPEVVEHEALEPGQGVLPMICEKFNGHNLIQEYFSFPSRFWFFTLTGLRTGLSRIAGPEVEIVVLLNQPPRELAEQVGLSNFALFCTPVVNLFPLEIESIELQSKGKFHAGNEVVVRPVAPDYEVFRIEHLFGHIESTSEKLEFLPRHDAFNRDESNSGRFYTVRRTPRESGDASRRYGTRTPYTGSDLIAALVDRHEQPYASPLSYLSADVWVTNGDLPNLLTCNGKTDLTPFESTPIGSIGLVRAPSAPKPPLAHGRSAWDLIGQLNSGMDTLDLFDEDRSAEALRKLLRLFVDEGTEAHQQIESIVSLKIEGVTRKLPGRGPIHFGRGYGIRLTVDEKGFGASSPYLFGVVVDRYLGRHVSAHSFVQLDLYTIQRDLIASLPVRMGMRGVV
ncbi:type VI secretion system baseplate subunit TssF [Caballeronia sp. S22]|uniref:type VI secretion system baseplate subunit TssF n=1 Tax=Caballeronia sp. S22 TaxID=3137182 RepID=UPI003530848F